MQSRLERMNPDALRLIMMELPPEQALEKCSSTEKFRDVCSDNFWKEKLRKDFKFEQLDFPARLISNFKIQYLYAYEEELYKQLEKSIQEINEDGYHLKNNESFHFLPREPINNPKVFSKLEKTLERMQEEIKKSKDLREKYIKVYQMSLDEMLEHLDLEVMPEIAYVKHRPKEFDDFDIIITKSEPPKQYLAYQGKLIPFPKSNILPKEFNILLRKINKEKLITDRGELEDIVNLLYEDADFVPEGIAER